MVRTYESELAKWLNERFGFAGDAEQAQAFFAGLPAEQQRIFARQVYFAELRAGGREYNEVGGVRQGSYLRGRNAIAALFPERDPAGNPISYEGDIVMYGGAGVHTDFGGDIQLLSPAGARCSVSRARRRRLPQASSPRARAISRPTRGTASCSARAAS